MPEVLSENAISLTVPADKSMMLVIRLTTAGVLARARLTVDAIDFTAGFLRNHPPLQICTGPLSPPPSPTV